jgi:large subunit ribosomal protein L11
MPEVIKVLVEGGKASAGPPLGPALGPLGVNLMEVVEEINRKTQGYQRMKVPVKVIVDTSNKSFTVEVGMPPVASLIKNELGIEKGSPSNLTQKVGDLKFDQVVKIAKLKQDSLLGKDIKRKAKEVLGSCFSLGVTVDGKDPREVMREIDEGKYDTQVS